MSLSASLSSALSGLSAMSRASLTVSSNVANAQTEGYAPRALTLASASIGGGVRVVSEDRAVDAVLVRDLRLASASAAAGDVTGQYLNDAMDAFGRPGDPSSLTNRLSDVEVALIASTARPDDEAALQNVLDAMQSLTAGLNGASSEIQSLREDADAQIAMEVANLNRSLLQVGELNKAILALGSDSGSANALLDQRQQVVDQIADQVSLRTVSNENGTISLFTTTGLTLLETTPVTLQFTPRPVITADMTIDSGALSGLSIGGRDVSSTSPSSSLSGGRIEALFMARDATLPDLQSKLDGLASSVLTAFQDPALDPTRLAGDPGFFTDAGAPFDLVNTAGIAGRIDVNPALDPASGGDVWRLRAGLGATDAGQASASDLLLALNATLAATAAPAIETGLTGDRTLGSTFADVSASLAQQLVTADANAAFRSSRRTALESEVLAKGVDTDQELQKLLQIEQAYAANARVIQTTSDLIQILIEI